MTFDTWGRFADRTLIFLAYTTAGIVVIIADDESKDESESDSEGLFSFVDSPVSFSFVSVSSSGLSDDRWVHSRGQVRSQKQDVRVRRRRLPQKWKLHVSPSSFVSVKSFISLFGDSQLGSCLFGGQVIDVTCLICFVVWEPGKQGVLASDSPEIFPSLILEVGYTPCGHRGVVSVATGSVIQIDIE